MVMLRLAMQALLWCSTSPQPQLSFDVYHSGGAGPHDVLPTVVLLHGRNDAFHGLRRALRYSRQPLRVVVPWGPYLQRDGTHAWFRRTEVRRGAGAGQEVLSAAVQVDELLRALLASGTVQGRPVLVGYSQGAAVALEVSVRHPESVGEVVAISGHLPPSHVPSSLQEHGVTHVLIGEDDRIMSAKVVLEQVQHLQALGYLIELVRFPDLAHGMSTKMRRVALRRIYAALSAQAARRG